MNESHRHSKNKNPDQEQECCDLYEEYCYPCDQDEADKLNAKRGLNPQDNDRQQN